MVTKTISVLLVPVVALVRFLRLRVYPAIFALIMLRVAMQMFVAVWVVVAEPLAMQVVAEPLLVAPRGINK